MSRGPWKKKSHKDSAMDHLVRLTVPYPYMDIPDSDAGPVTSAVAGRWTKSRYERWRQPCGMDAVSMMNVVDALMNVNPMAAVRASNLTELLNTRYNALLWDTRIVGNLLSDLAIALEDTGDEMPPFITRAPRDSAGLSYMLDYNVETVRLMRALRGELLVAAHEEIRLRNQGQKPRHSGMDIILNLPTMRQKMDNK